MFVDEMFIFVGHSSIIVKNHPGYGATDRVGFVGDNIAVEWFRCHWNNRLENTMVFMCFSFSI